MDIHQYWKAVLTQDAAAMRKYITEDALIEWPCTNECFSREMFIDVNCRYPGNWTGAVESVYPTENGFVCIACVRAKNGAESHHAIGIYRLRNDRISHLTEYWAEDGPAPAWRQPLTALTKKEERNK